jgi:hypothetical protein
MSKKTQSVDGFMKNLKHPLKAEIEALRTIIKSVNKNITEEIKWAAPSFSYYDYIATFNPRDKKRVHLVFHNPLIEGVKSKLLEGDYRGRRMAYFADMKDVKSKKSELIKVIKELIKLMERTGGIDSQKSDLPFIGSPARRALAIAGYTKLSDLTKVSEAELLKLHGFGPKAIKILKPALKAQGKSFKK